MSQPPASPEAQPKPSRIWAFVIIFLLVVTAVGIIITLVRYEPAQPVEIRLPTPDRLSGSIQVSGAVTNPGIYPLTPDDTINDVLQFAGGTTGKADEGSLSLVVQTAGTGTTAQKININRADVWLLEALPGIGETRAKTIVAYREANGLFKTTTDIMKVEGIGQSVHDQIKDLITVTD